MKGIWGRKFLDFLQLLKTVPWNPQFAYISMPMGVGDLRVCYCSGSMDLSVIIFHYF